MNDFGIFWSFFVNYFRGNSLLEDIFVILVRLKFFEQSNWKKNHAAFTLLRNWPISANNESAHGD